MNTVMKRLVYIRPLVLDDALITYHWRNNPSIWPYSGLRPDRLITPERETEWLASILEREDEKRFAICLQSNDQLIGCIYLTDIHNKQAAMRIYFGELKYWGAGRAYRACRLLFDHAFNVLGIEKIFIEINPSNKAAKQLAKQMGYEKIEKIYDSRKRIILDKMVFNKDQYKF